MYTSRVNFSYDNNNNNRYTRGDVDNWKSSRRRITEIESRYNIKDKFALLNRVVRQQGGDIRRGSKSPGQLIQFFGGLRKRQHRNSRTHSTKKESRAGVLKPPKKWKKERKKERWKILEETKTWRKKAGVGERCQRAVYVARFCLLLSKNKILSTFRPFPPPFHPSLFFYLCGWFSMGKRSSPHSHLYICTDARTPLRVCKGT